MRSRIHSFILSPYWENHCLNASQKWLPRVLLDHFPLLLDCNDVVRSRGYFKFENIWLKFEGFVEKLKQWWSSYSFHGSPCFVLAVNLKALNLDLKK